MSSEHGIVRVEARRYDVATQLACRSTLPAMLGSGTSFALISSGLLKPAHPCGADPWSVCPAALDANCALIIAHPPASEAGSLSTPEVGLIRLRLTPSGLTFWSVCLAALDANPRVRIPNHWRSRASPTIKLLAPEVGVVGASSCCLNIYDECYSVCRDNFFVLCHCPDRNIQNSLLAVLLTDFLILRLATARGLRSGKTLKN